MTQAVKNIEENLEDTAINDSAVLLAEQEKGQETDQPEADKADQTLELTAIDFITQLENNPQSLLQELASLGENAFVRQIITAAPNQGNPTLVKQKLRDFIAQSQVQIEQQTQAQPVDVDMDATDDAVVETVFEQPQESVADDLFDVDMAGVDAVIEDSITEETVTAEIMAEATVSHIMAEQQDVQVTAEVVATVETAVVETVAAPSAEAGPEAGRVEIVEMIADSVSVETDIAPEQTILPLADAPLFQAPLNANEFIQAIKPKAVIQNSVSVPQVQFTAPVAIMEAPLQQQTEMTFVAVTEVVQDVAAEVTAVIDAPAMVETTGIVATPPVMDTAPLAPEFPVEADVFETIAQAVETAPVAQAEHSSIDSRNPFAGLTEEDLAGADVFTPEAIQEILALSRSVQTAEQDITPSENIIDVSADAPVDLLPQVTTEPVNPVLQLVLTNFDAEEEQPFIIAEPVLQTQTMRAYSSVSDKPILNLFNQNVVEKSISQARTLDNPTTNADIFEPVSLIAVQENPALAHDASKVVSLYPVMEDMYAMLYAENVGPAAPARNTTPAYEPNEDYTRYVARSIPKAS